MSVDELEPEQLVQRNVLRAQVKDVIMQRIIQGVYAPGARLIETRIARELGVSQGPVREALRDLESVGVIESSAFRGASVRKPDREQLLGAFPVRAALESLAAAEATLRAGPEQLRELGALIDTMVEAASVQDVHTQAAANSQFHGLIVRMAGNPTLERVWSMLEPFARTYLTAVHAGIDLRILAERHRKILDPMRSGSAHLAANAMRQHLLEAADWLRRGGELE